MQEVRDEVEPRELHVDGRLLDEQRALEQLHHVAEAVRVVQSETHALLNKKTVGASVCVCVCVGGLVGWLGGWLV